MVWFFLNNRIKTNDIRNIGFIYNINLILRKLVFFISNFVLLRQTVKTAVTNAASVHIGYQRSNKRKKLFDDECAEVVMEREMAKRRVLKCSSQEN